jgi:hypothetical protein
MVPNRPTRPEMKREIASARSSRVTKIVTCGRRLPNAWSWRAKTMGSMSGEARMTLRILGGSPPSRMAAWRSASIVSLIQKSGLRNPVRGPRQGAQIH